MTILPVAEFMPDMPDLADATSIATNCIALTPTSYGPLPSPAVFTVNAIDAMPRGMGYAEDTALSHHIFAGTLAKIWAINGTATNWVDASGSAYNTAGEGWHFAQYKNLMLATNYRDPIQRWDMTGAGGATFGTLSATAPKARFIAVAKNFAIVANTSDPVGGANPARIWWSANGDPANWPTPGSLPAQQTQSDYNDMLGPQGQIIGLAPNLAGCDCAVFFERAVFRMIYAGPPDIFNFYPAATVRGAIGPNSIVVLGSLAYYLGEDGFYRFDGNTSMPIGANKVDKFFFSLVDQSSYNMVIGAADIANKAIVWAFRSLYATTPNPDRLLIFRWDIQRWSYGTIPSQWIGRVPLSTTATVPLVAGQLQLGIIDASLRLGYFSGTPMLAQIGTKVVQITPDRRSFVQGSRPLVEASTLVSWLLAEDGRILDTEALEPIRVDYGGALGPPLDVPLLTEDFRILLGEDGTTILLEEGSPFGVLTVAMSARVNYYDQEIFGPEIPPDISGQCSVRSEGRYHRGRLTVYPGAWTNFVGLDVQSIRSGTR